jgi:hypothetical protein
MPSVPPSPTGKSTQSTRPGMKSGKTKKMLKMKIAPGMYMKTLRQEQNDMAIHRCFRRDLHGFCSN